MGHDKELSCLGQARSFALFAALVENPLRKISEVDLKLNLEFSTVGVEFDSQVVAPFKPGQFAMIRWGAHIIARPYTIVAIKKKSDSVSVLTLWIRPTLGPTRELWDLKKGDRVFATLPLGRGVEESFVSAFGLELLNQPMLFVTEGARSAAVWAYFELRRKTRLILGAQAQDFWVHREDSQDFVDSELMSRSYARPDQIVLAKDFKDFKLQALDERFKSAICAVSDASFESLHADTSNLKFLCRTSPRMACGVGLCFSCTVITDQGPKRACLEGPWFGQVSRQVGVL